MSWLQVRDSSFRDGQDTSAGVFDQTQLQREHGEVQLDPRKGFR